MPDPADSVPSGQPRSVILYKKERCPLCDEALEVLRTEARRKSFTLTVRDITHDPELLAAHGQEVPVVFIDGRKQFFGHVDPVLFRRALDRR
jgi:glutaredoxin